MYSDLKSSANTNALIVLLQFCKTSIFRCGFGRQISKLTAIFLHSLIFHLGDFMFHPYRCFMLLCVFLVQLLFFPFPIRSPPLVAIKMDVVLLVAPAPGAFWISDPVMISEMSPFLLLCCFQSSLQQFFFLMFFICAVAANRQEHGG